MTMSSRAIVDQQLEISYHLLVISLLGIIISQFNYAKCH